MFGNAGGNGVRSDGTVAGRNHDAFRVRVKGRSPNGSEYGSSLDLSFP